MRKRRRRATLGSGLVGLVAALTLVIAGAATADHGYQGAADDHVLTPGNPTCPAGTADAGTTNIQDAQLNTSYDDGRIRITDRGGDPDAFSWQLVDEEVDVVAVIVKGGNNAYIYYYGSGTLSDTGLTPPLNNGGQAPAISHVDFCFDPKDDDGGPLDLIVNKSAQTSWEKVYTWNVDKSVDPDHLEMKTGDTGTVDWKVDVTQTGFVARNAVVSGEITVANPNDAEVTNVGITDALPGAIVDCDGVAGAPYVNVLSLDGQGFRECTYTAPRDSTAGGTNEATAQATLDGVDISDTGTADFEFGDPAVEINKTVKAVDGKNTWSDIGGSASFTYEETFRCPGQGRTNVVDLLGDNPATPEVETDFVLDTDSASVTVTCGSTPPPPPPPPPPTVTTDESMDVQVVKDATPQVQLVNGQADIAYTVRVRNNGPNQAHNVTLVDAAPSGVTFLAVTLVGGDCTVSASLLSCTLGTLGPGVERTIGLSARVTQTGTYVNSATGTGDGKDTNGANNTDDASTLVTAPVTPPTATPTLPVKAKPKPKPKPVANICRVLKVTPGMVKANGKRQLVLAKVTRSRTPVQGVQVRFTSKGLNKAVKTNKQGVARLSVKPSKAGIMLVKITSAKACNSARIGVVGVFEPPVTG